MEPLGILVFAVFMISSFLQVLIESTQRLLDPHLEQTHIPPIALATMVGTIVVKGAVWLSCRAIKSASVEALQQDAENDIVFNFFSLVFPFVGEVINWPYLDPLGGAVLSLYSASTRPFPPSLSHANSRRLTVRYPRPPGMTLADPPNSHHRVDADPPRQRAQAHGSPRRSARAPAHRVPPDALLAARDSHPA